MILCTQVLQLPARVASAPGTRGTVSLLLRPQLSAASCAAAHGSSSPTLPALAEQSGAATSRIPAHGTHARAAPARHEPVHWGARQLQRLKQFLSIECHTSMTHNQHYIACPRNRMLFNVYHFLFLFSIQHLLLLGIYKPMLCSGGSYRT